MNVRFLWDEKGPAIIKPSVYNDNRGYFFESYNDDEFKKHFKDVNFVQDNESRSSYGIVRGLHFQKPPFAQAKLVRVVKGAVFDVAVDLRKGSPTYGQWCGAYLSGENKRQFFIPRGFAHGFLSLSDDTVFQYKCDNGYNKESEGSLFYLDPDINITWDDWINRASIITSPKDNAAELFNNFETPFKYDE